MKTLPGYSALVSEIDGLPADDGYDADYRPPTAGAIARVKDFLDCTRGLMKVDFPAGEPMPDGDGGLRVYWLRPARNLQLNVPASDVGPFTLFWRDGLDYALIPDPSPADLAERLTCFGGE